MCLQFQKLGFMICKEIIVNLLKVKAKQSFANLIKIGSICEGLYHIYIVKKIKFKNYELEK